MRTRNKVVDTGNVGGCIKNAYKCARSAFGFLFDGVILYH